MDAELLSTLQTIVVAVISAVGGGAFWSYLSQRSASADAQEERILKRISEERDRVEKKLDRAQEQIARQQTMIFLLMGEMQKLDPTNKVVEWAIKMMQAQPGDQAEIDGLHRQMDQMRKSIFNQMTGAEK